MTEKTGKMLTALSISDHLMASDMLDVDSNESNIIIAKLTKKGFKTLEVSLAACFLILFA